MASLRACSVRHALAGEPDQGGSTVGRMLTTRHQAGCFQRIDQIGHVARGTPQRLAELALSHSRLPLPQAPDDLGTRSA